MEELTTLITSAPPFNDVEQRGPNCSNHSIDEDTGIFEKSTESYAVPIVFAVIFIVGIVGNGTTIFIVLRNKVMRNVPNIFIVSLATGDLLLLLTSVPFTATIYTFKQWPYGKSMCKVNECLQTLSLGISVFTLTVLSWDRYNAISRPMQKAKGNMLRRTCITAVLVWIVSFCLALIDAIGANLSVHKNCGKELIICVVQPQSWGEEYTYFRTVFRFLIYFSLPMLFICFFYISMAITLINSSKQLLCGRQAKGTSAQKQIEARKKVARVVLSFVIVFVMCWFPRHIYLFWYVFDPGQYNLFWHVYKIVSFCFCFINSCMNPLALYFLSRQFRGYFHKYLLCCCGDGTIKLPKTKMMAKQCRNGPVNGNKGAVGCGSAGTSYDGYTCMVTSTRQPGNQLKINGNNCGHGVYTNDTTRIISTSPSTSHRILNSSSLSPSNKDIVYINMYRKDEPKNKYRNSKDLC